MIRISLLLIFIVATNYSFAQHKYWTKESPYKVSLKKDIALTGLSVGTLILGIQAEKNEAIPTFEMGSFTQTDINEINKFDRGFAGNWDVDAKDKGKIFKTTATMVVPFGLLALPGDLESRATLGLLYFQGRFLNGGLVSFAKGKTNRYRPYTYLTLDQIEVLTGEAREEFLEDVADDDIEDSFYSGDAAATSYGLMFFAKVFNDYYPDSKWKYAVWTASGIGVGLGAYYRAKSGKHFPTDVIVGSIVGGSLGILIPHLHKKKENSNLSISPNKNGLSLVYKIK